MKYQKRPVNIEGWQMYEVDTNGVVYSQSGKPLKYSLNRNGYCIVNFNYNHIRKGFAVHTLVAKTFLSNPENKPTVNHIDGNKQNNSVDNLEWATYKEQMEHAKNVLGYNKTGANNCNAKAIQGFDKKTHELKYEFDCLADAARFFTKPNHNYRNIQNVIWRVLAAKKGRKSYKGCVWEYG